MSNMFCFQCQEAAKGTGCTLKGVCGKNDTTARAMDLLLFTVRGIEVFVAKGIPRNRNSFHDGSRRPFPAGSHPAEESNDMEAYRHILRNGGILHHSVGLSV